MTTPMPTTVLLSSAYLAPVVYYAQLSTHRRALVEQYDHYHKQTYRNRCIIAGPSGRQALTVPIQKPATEKCFMRDIRLSDHGRWRHLHLTAMESAYNNSPFYEYYKDDFLRLYAQPFTFLMDFNDALCRLVCNLIGIPINLTRTASYVSEPPADITDLRDLIHPKRDPRLADPAYEPVPYWQVFQDRHGFLPDLSIVDLLFNMGPESLLVLNGIKTPRG